MVRKVSKVSSDSEVIQSLQEENQRLWKEKDELVAENKGLRKVMERPDFMKVALKNEWYVLNGIRNHIENLKRSVNESKESLLKAKAKEDYEVPKWMEESMKNMEWELERHIRDYTSAYEELQTVMNIR